MTARRFSRAARIGLTVGALLLTVFCNLWFQASSRQYAWLAQAFVHGRLDIDASAVADFSFNDLALRDGRYYWPCGVLPAVVLAPAAALFGPRMELQPVLQALLALLTYVVALRVARRAGHGDEAAGWLALAFVCGSVAVSTLPVNSSWQLAGAMASLLILAACGESLGKNRPAVIGALVGLAATARFTAGLGIVYFIAHELCARRASGNTMHRLTRMAVPFLLALLLLGAYNHLRFGSWTDTGLTSHRLIPGAIAESRAAGSFRLANVRANLYAYALQPPDLIGGLPVANPNGMSVLILSPAFLYLWWADRRSPAFLAALAASVPSLAVFLTYFTTGFFQFGPRYLFDLAPFWFLVLAETLRARGVGRNPKLLIAASATVNVFLLAVFIGYYFTSIDA